MTMAGHRLFCVALVLASACAGCVSESYRVRASTLEGLRAQPPASLRRVVVPVVRVRDGKDISVRASLLLAGSVEAAPTADEVIVQTRRSEPRRTAGAILTAGGLALLGTGIV